MNRIDQRFADLRAAGQKGFVAYIGAGDPNLEATEHIAVALDAAGVDVLELGVPFSDPLADGLVNQLAAQRGLASGTTPAKLLDSVANIRKRSQVPLFSIYTTTSFTGVVWPNLLPPLPRRAWMEYSRWIFRPRRPTNTKRICARPVYAAFGW